MNTRKVRSFLVCLAALELSMAPVARGAAPTASEALETIAAWEALVRDFPITEGDPAEEQETICQRAETILKEAEQDEVEVVRIDPARLVTDPRMAKIEVRKVVDGFADRLAQWLATEAPKDPDHWPERCLQTLFSQGYKEEQEKFKKLVGDAASAPASAGRQRIEIPRTLLVLKPMLGPARWFLAAELVRLVKEKQGQPGGVSSINAQDIKAALHEARLRRFELEVRFDRLRAVFARGPLLVLLGTDRCASLQNRYKTLLESMATAEALVGQSAVPPAAPYGEVIALDEQITAASVELEKAFARFRQLSQTVLGEAVVAGATLRDRAAAQIPDHLDFPPVCQTGIRARMEREAESQGEPQFHVEFFLIRPSVAHLKITSADPAAPETVEAVPLEEIPLGIDLSHIRVVEGHLLFSHTLKWERRVYPEKLRSALVRVGVPAWLVKDVSAELMEDGKLRLTLKGEEPDLSAFGLEKEAIGEIAVTLDLYSGHFSLEHDLLDALREREVAYLHALWDHVWVGLGKRTFEGVTFREDTSAAGTGAKDTREWVHRVVAERAKQELFSFEVMLDASASLPKVTVRRFEISDSLRAYVRDQAVQELRSRLPAGPTDLTQFMTVTLSEPASGGDAFELAATVGLSFRSLKIKVPPPPPVGIRFRPFAAGEKWLVTGPKWDEWVQGQFAQVKDAVATAMQSYITGAIDGLEGTEWDLAMVKVKVLAPIVYEPKKGYYQIDTEWRVAGAEEATFRLNGVRVRGGYDPKEKKWGRPKFDLSQAKLADPAKLEETVRAMLHLPKQLGNDRFHLISPRCDAGGGLSFAIHLGFPELGFSCDTSEITISTDGVKADLRASLVKALSETLKKNLSKPSLQIKDIGPVRSITFDPEHSSFEADPKVSVLAKLHLMDRDYEVPMQVFPQPDLSAFKSALEAIVQDEVSRWLQHALKVNLPNFKLESRGFEMNPLRLKVWVKFSVPKLFDLEIDPCVIDEHGLELPDRIAIGLEEFGKILSKAIHGASSGTVTLVKPGAVFYPKDSGRFDLTGDLTFGKEEVTKVLHVHATLETNLLDLSNFKLGLHGNLVVLDNTLFQVEGGLNLAAKQANLKASASGLLANVLDPSLEAVVDFGQLSFREKAGVRVLHLNLANVDFGLCVRNGVKIDGNANADLLIGRMNGRLDAEFSHGRFHWLVGAGVDVSGSVPIAHADVSVNARRARLCVNVFKFPLSVSVPSTDSLTPALLLQLLGSLVDFDPRALENILKGKIELSPGHGHEVGDSSSSDSQSTQKDDADSDDSDHSAAAKTADQPPSAPPADNDKKEPASTPETKDAQASTPPEQPPQGDGIGPVEKGVPVWSARGVREHLPEAKDGAWLIDRMDKDEALHSWRTFGHTDGSDKTAASYVWRVVVVKDEAFVVPYYFSKEAAEADDKTPRKLLAGVARFIPDPKVVPSPVAHELIETLLGAEGEAGGEAVGAGSGEKPGAVTAAELASVEEVFPVVYPLPTPGQGFEDAPKVNDPFACSAVVMRFSGHELFLVRLHAEKRTVRFTVKISDPLLGSHFLPATEAEGQKLEVARFVGQYASLDKGGPDAWQEVLTHASTVWMLGGDQLVALRRAATAMPLRFAVHYPAGREPLTAPDGRVWAPIAQCLDEQFPAGTPAAPEELYVDGARPTRLLLLKPGEGTSWGVRLFTPPPDEALPVRPFTDANGNPMPSEWQTLGQTLMDWVRRAEVSQGKPNVVLFGCGSGVNPQGDESVVRDSAGCPKGHWAIRLVLAEDGGRRRFSWTDANPRPPLSLAEYHDAGNPDELHAQVEDCLRAGAAHEGGSSFILALPQLFSFPPVPGWALTQQASGAEIAARYRDWVTNRHAVNPAAPLDLSQPAAQQQLAAWVFAPAWEWGESLYGHPVGLVFGEQE